MELVICLLAYCLSQAAEPVDPYVTWLHGAVGYQEGMDKATKEDQPLILCFHTKDCQWGKRFKEEYLSNPAVKTYLDTLIRVEIDPNTGEFEKSITDEDYSIAHFPMIVVTVPSFGVKATKLNPFRKKDEDLKPEQFLMAVRQAIADLYNEKAFSFDKTGEFDKAVKYLNMALSHDPDNAYAHSALGTCYVALARQKNDLGLLKQAEEHFGKAAQLNPKDEQARKGLTAVREALKKAGTAPTDTAPK